MSTKQASRTNVSGQCEMIAKCERTTELSQNTERKRLGPTRTTKKGRHLTTTNATLHLLALLEEWSGGANQKFPSFPFTLRREVWGMKECINTLSSQKNERKIFGFAALLSALPNTLRKTKKTENCILAILCFYFVCSGYGWWACRRTC